MKRFYLALLTMVFTFAICPISYAQTVGYTYKPLAAEGCSMKYSIAKHENQYYIIATVSSDRLQFLSESTMLIRTTNGEVLKLSGELMNNRSESAGIVSGNMVLPVTSIISSAQFSITPEQLEMIKSGVIKIRLSTTPIEHEREFTKDKIGKKLYEFYLNIRDKNNDF